MRAETTEFNSMAKKKAAKKKTKKLSGKEIGKMKAAAIAAVVAEISAGGRPAGVAESRSSGRENWKMAGRAERLGIGSI